MSTMIATKSNSALNALRHLSIYRCNFFRASSRFFKETDPRPDDPRDPHVIKENEKHHPETPLKHHPDLLSPEPLKGKPFDKVPFRIELKANKLYHYCTCGISKQQPFCDGSHKAPYLMQTKALHIKYRPIKFTVEETKEYWLCQCKQSDNRPFCDGSHKKEEVQKAVRS